MFHHSNVKAIGWNGHTKSAEIRLIVVTYTHTHTLLFPFQALVKVKKDNDMIYHDKIPPHSDLPQVGKAVVAKPLPMAEKMSSSNIGMSPEGLSI